MSRRGNGEGSIYRREIRDPRTGKVRVRWEAEITTGWGGGGKREKKTVTAPSRAGVLARLEVEKSSLKAGARPSDGRLTVAAYLEGWIESVEPTFAPRTHRRYADLLRQRAIPEIGRVKLVELGPEHVRRMLAAALKGGPDGKPKPLALQTVHHLRAALRRALADAVDTRQIPRNVAGGRLAKLPKARGWKVDALSPEQADAVLRAVADDRLAPLFALALTSGLRQGELLGLRWTDVDLDGPRPIVHVRQTVGRLGGRVLWGEPKTDQSRRSVPLHGLAIAALPDHRHRQKVERLAAGERWVDLGEHGPLVFATLTGEPLEPSHVTHRLQDLLAAAGLPRMRFHDLRHGLATLLIESGVHMRVVMEILGHTTITTTMNVYGHVLDSAKRDAIAGLDVSRAAAGS